MSGLVDALAAMTAPWADLYAESTVIETAVLFLHLGGMLAAGGLAFTLDRAVIRSARGWPDRGQLAREIHASHGAVLGGLAVVFLSGAMLTASDPGFYLLSIVFWAKMGVVVLLLVNGWFLKRAGEHLLAEPESEGAFRALRGAALRSGGLWALSVLAGVAVTLYV